MSKNNIEQQLAKIPYAQKDKDVIEYILKATLEKLRIDINLNKSEIDAIKLKFANYYDKDYLDAKFTDIYTKSETITEIENRIPDVSNLVTKTELNDNLNKKENKLVNGNNTVVNRTDPDNPKIDVNIDTSNFAKKDLSNIEEDGEDVIITTIEENLAQPLTSQFDWEAIEDHADEKAYITKQYGKNKYVDNKKWNESVGYNDGGSYYFQVRNIEKEFTGFNALRTYLKSKFANRSNYVARGGIIVYETDNTSQPYWLPFEASGSSEPAESDNLIINFAPKNKEIHINGKAKIASLFSLKIIMSDFNIFDCFIEEFVNTINRYMFDDELKNYFLNEGRITLTSAMGLNFGKIDWST